jgi:hypothetical protein
MLTLESFSGINNVQPSERLGKTDLVAAMNVDIGLTGEVRRRAGYALEHADCHKNLHQARGFLLATVAGDLTAISAAGTRTLLYPALGMDRVHYCDLPDGRVAWSNGLINGVTDGVAHAELGVPLPAGVGSAQVVAGALDAGTYIYQVSHVRMSDGLEGGAIFGGTFDATADSGLLITGLPELAGYATNIYLSSPNGDVTFLAGTALGAVFSYLGKASDLVLPCRTQDISPPPVGKWMAFWRTRVLVAQGCTLWASRPNGWESFNQRKDFKQFSAPITMVQSVDNGVWVGTEHELAWLGGDDFDGLTYRRALDAPVVPGSGVSAPGERVQLGEGTGRGRAAICIAGGHIVACFSDGLVFSLSEGRYRTDAAEVAAVFREINGVPQYVAVAQ